jgi:hypothetical protein
MTLALLERLVFSGIAVGKSGPPIHLQRHHLAEGMIPSPDTIWILQTFVVIAITVVIHLIGIGVFLVWFAAGRPISRKAFETRWRNVHLISRWKSMQEKKGVGRDA